MRSRRPRFGTGGGPSTHRRSRVGCRGYSTVPAPILPAANDERRAAHERTSIEEGQGAIRPDQPEIHGDRSQTDLC